MLKIIDIRHPDYQENSQTWEKWRLTYNAGDPFIAQYLEKYSIREDEDTFALRKALTYSAAFAKSSVNDVKNAIYQRTGDIYRIGGSQSYQAAIIGDQNGVDLLGSTMSFFIGRYILRELLPMSRVGIYVDMPILDSITKRDKGIKHPYIYHYPIEDILSWSYDQTSRPNEFSSVLLRDNTFEYENGLPKSKIQTYRHIYLNSQGTVSIDFYDKAGNLSSQAILSLTKIPFVMPDIGESLLADVCNYQIALMNLESSDVGYILTSNYPFYVEQTDFRGASQHIQNGDEDPVVAGPSQGRLYPLNTNQPAFIHPSSEPLEASMKKQDNIKRDIKTLVNLALSNLNPKMASAESKEVDNQGLEAGLSYIGLVLQAAEAKIAEYWSLYESANPAVVIYPTEYQLPNRESIREDITLNLKLLETINSPTYRKELVKKIVRQSIGTTISAITLKDIDTEINDATIVAADSATIAKDIEAGLVSIELASRARGYPEGEADQAKIDHAERLALIAQAQSKGPAEERLGPRGIDDASPDPRLEAKLEKVGKNGRGEAE